MIVVLEGPDRAGKSTIARAIAERLAIPVVHPWMDLTNPKPSAMSVARTVNRVLERCRPDVILDRYYFSELIYGKVLGREVDYLYDLIAASSSIPDLFVVLVTASARALRARYRQRPDAYVAIDELMQIRQLYPTLLDALPSTVPTLTLDTTRQTVANSTQDIIDWIGLA